jgi:hypothetical protein
MKLFTWACYHPFINLSLTIIKMIIKLILMDSMSLAFYRASLGITLKLFMISGIILNMHSQDSDKHVSLNQQFHASPILSATMAQVLAISSQE